MNAIADTGFLVAFLNERDAHHSWAVEWAKKITMPLLTCEPVITEAAFLVRSGRLVLDLIAAGMIRVEFSVTANRLQLASLHARFSDREPDMCDLGVVRMSELFPELSVLTTDRKDFMVYRRNIRELIPTIFPPRS